MVGMALTNIGSLDHAHIVSAVTNTANSFLGISSDHTSDVGFLSRRTTTRYHSW